MSQRRLPLADIKRKLKQQNAQPVRKPVGQPPAGDDISLFHEAVAGVQAIRPDDHAEIQRPRPAPRPRLRTTEDTPPPPQKQADHWVPASWLADEEADKPTGEVADLVQALAGVKPITTDKAFPEQPKPHPHPIQHQRDEQAALRESIYSPTSLEMHLEGGDELTHLSNGVPRSVIRDLRRGRWVVQDQLDLHGCNRDEARDLLASCMGQWRRRGIRCVRVIHGKGRGSPGREPVLKRLVAGWLMNYENVMAYCQARLPEGGAGALIVLLKASRPGPGPLL
jgi:DNA-nicking Smr family endonuclease